MQNTRHLFSVRAQCKRPLDTSYDIIIGKDCDGEIVKAVREIPAIHSVAIVTDNHTKKLYGEHLRRLLKHRIPRTHLFSFSAGERNKNQRTKTMLEHGLLAKQCGRDTVILAVGGGVVGDMAGFVAATYCRGIPYIQIPTTLLAMIDSSVGGKTAIDTPYGKNMIGAFWQPKKVIIDINHLWTLPREHIVSGLCEAVKLFITSDPSVFPTISRFLQKANDRDARAIIAQAVQLKADIVRRDETEHGERMTLNFGHTIGHALERLSGYRLLHGIGVGFGVLIESKISELLGVLSHREYERIESIMRSFKLPMQMLKRYSSRAIINTARNDKKSRGGATQFVLLKKIGSVYVRNRKLAHPVSDAIVIKAIHYFTR